MRDPFSRNFFVSPSSRESWPSRIRQNFHQLLEPARIFPSSANGAPLHLLARRSAPLASAPRLTSLLAHTALVLSLLLLHGSAQDNKKKGDKIGNPPLGPLTFVPPSDSNLFGRLSLGKKSGGGEEDPRPARRGVLAPASSIPIVPPRREVEAEPVLAMPVSVYDANASPYPTPVTEIGLPWMKNDSDSVGPGKDHGIGSGKKGGMGDDEGPGAGRGDSYNGPYANVATMPLCAYCPDPLYTDEAREAKMQGRVTLRVLVGADGRTSRVQITQGIGLGLDERAVEAVRGWKFVPAQDAAKRNVPAWVTIEVVFRLI